MVAPTRSHPRTSKPATAGTTPMVASEPFRVRVVDYRLVPASELVVNPANPRRHPYAQKSALLQSLADVGFAGAELVRQLPDGRLELIDGELRQTVSGDQSIPCLITDLTDEEARTLLATHDAITLMALYDETRSAALAASLDAHRAAAADLLRLVAEQQPARDLLTTLALRDDPYTSPGGDDEDRAGWPASGVGGVGDSDEDEGAPEGGEIVFAGVDDDDVAVVAATGEALFDDERVIEAAFAHYRATGFPYRALPVYTSMQKLNRLARTPTADLLATTLCGDVADTYHPHRFHARVEGMNTPYESFQEDKLLRHALALRLADRKRIQEGYITTLDVVHHTQACYNFRPGFAAYVYRMNCRPGAVVLDTSTGYGGRLLGFLASGVWRVDETDETDDDAASAASAASAAERRGAPTAPTAPTVGRYLGIDPNSLTHAGNLRMAAEFGVESLVELVNLPAEEVDVDARGWREIADFAFTSPPYFARERYSDEETQSWKRYPTPEAWRAGFLRPMLALQFAALKPGAVSLVNVDEVSVGRTRHALPEWVRAEAEAVGFVYEETLTFPLHADSGLGGPRAEGRESEPILVLRKPLSAERAPHRADAPYSAAAAAKLVPVPVPVFAQAERAPGMPAGALPLEDWMGRLYHLSADERRLTGWLGVWPEELRVYLEQMCLLYTPTEAAPARFAVAPGLITREPTGTAVDADGRPYEPETCALFFSGGKDCIAAGLRVEREAGYRRILAVYLRRVNKGMPREARNAERIARELGWDFVALRPASLPKVYGESFVKNQYALAATLAHLDVTPGAVAFGNHVYHDVTSCPWYSDMACAFDAFDEALVAAWPRTRRLPGVRDEVDAYAVWRDTTRMTALAQELTTSCCLPEHNKVQHRRRSLAKGVPLLEYECGVCEKCRARALIFTTHFPDDRRARGYSEDYLKECRAKLAKVVAEPVEWAHTHPRLATWRWCPVMRQAEDGFTHYTRCVLGGVGPLSTVVAAPKTPAVEPVVTRLDARGYAMAGEPPLRYAAPAEEDDERDVDDDGLPDGTDDNNDNDNDDDDDETGDAAVAAYARDGVW